MSADIKQDGQIPFPTLRARRHQIVGPPDNLSEISAPALMESVALQTIRYGYLKLVSLRAGDAAEARRLVLAELDVVDDQKQGDCNE